MILVVIYEDGSLVRYKIPTLMEQNGLEQTESDSFILGSVWQFIAMKWKFMIALLVMVAAFVYIETQYRRQRMQQNQQANNDQARPHQD